MIPAGAGPALRFRQPVSLSIKKNRDRWIALVRELEAAGVGSTPGGALRHLRTAIQQQVRELVRALSTELSVTDRNTKARLLAFVDVPASQLDAAHANSYWYAGELSRDRDGSVWLRTGVESEMRFRVPPELAAAVDGLPRWGRVGVDDSGCPTGPVLELRRE